MTDEEFLGYCLLHSQTDRALFVAAHCRRLFELAGEPFPEPSLPNSAWRSMPSDLVKPLVEQAQRGLVPRLQPTNTAWNGTTCLKLDPEGQPCLRPHHVGMGHVFKCRTCLRLAVNGLSGAPWDDWRQWRDAQLDECVIVIHARRGSRALCQRAARR